MAVNNSSGILSSASKQIKKDLKMNDKQFGLFGTSTGFGRAFGCIAYILLVNKCNRKYIFSFFVLLKALFLYLFKASNKGSTLIFFRGVIGFAHMPPGIYIPVWIDQFGFSNYKTVQMTFLQVLIPLGKVIGYFFNILYGEKNWKYGFVTEASYLTFVGLFILVSPSKYFSTNLISSKNIKIHKNEKNEKNENNEKEHLSKLKKKQSTFIIQEQINENLSFEEILSQIKLILTNKTFQLENWIHSLMAGSLTAVHYWCADYMRNALEIEDQKLIFISYTIVCMIGPLLGMFLISFINYFFGSYESENAPLILFFLQLIGGIFGIFSVLMNNLFSFCFCLMVCLIFNISATTFIQGAILLSVGIELTGMANSIANLTQIIFVSGPSPVLYGAINDFFYPKGMKKIGMLSIMIIYFFASFLSFIHYLILKNKDNDENIVKKVEICEKSDSFNLDNKLNENNDIKNDEHNKSKDS